MSTEPAITSDAAERLRRRYPRPRLPRPLLIIAVTLLAAGSLVWLLLTATVHSRPVVSADVSAYNVLSDREISVTVTVDRPDPSVAVVCRLVAQATDFQTVGALDNLEIGPRPERVVNVTVTMKTLRRATSASVKSCTAA
ncbi:MAG: DUF4307 domain-containing protein [Propionibacteriaceae bacterium]|nr:DUF4307 domain-containing protein [Propionibacteriaceae bacterium]